MNISGFTTGTSLYNAGGRYRVVANRKLSPILLLFLAGVAEAANCPPTDRSPRTFYISVKGDDTANDGTLLRPFRTIQAGVDCLSLPGDRVFIYGGNYTEFVMVVNKHGALGKPIFIEGQPGITFGPVATIDGSITKLAHAANTYQFHLANNQEWICAPGQTTCKEYISRQAIPSPANNPNWFVNRASFVGPVNDRFTRLITYSRREDLQADNETFELITEGPGPGCPATDPRPGPTLGVSGGCTQRRPWVYMGPGIWFDTNSKRVHVRLSHTHNIVSGLPDYSGPTDPNAIGLAIAEKKMITLNVRGSSHIVFKNIGIRFGTESLEVVNSTNITFDSVDISAGQFGLRSGNNTGLRFMNSVFDGGLPTWMYRSDLKNVYSFRVGQQAVENNLGAGTMETLALGNGGDVGTEFEHCEFVNAHDLHLVGTSIRFHHNWINNLNDEALILDAGSIASGVVHDNVITQNLNAISFAGFGSAGPWRIYRNLIDLRSPTAGYRPRNAAFNRAFVWRFGRPFKDHEAAPDPDGTPHSDGPYDLFQNTFIVAFKADRSGPQPVFPQPPFDLLRSALQPRHQRRSLNNIFVVLNRETGVDKLLAFMPPADFPADIDGNLYYKRGSSGPALFYTPLPPPATGFALFACTMPDCLAQWRSTPFFLQSRALRYPGFEANSLLLKDPQFANWIGEEAPADDFRLTPGSPARGAGVVLPADIKPLDNAGPALGAPDIGCYQAQPGGTPALKLRVGVGGRRVYPPNGPGQ